MSEVLNNSSVSCGYDPERKPTAQGEISKTVALLLSDGHSPEEVRQVLADELKLLDRMLQDER